MSASILDRDAWIMEKEEEIAELLYEVAYVDLDDKIQGVVSRMAYYDYVDTMSAYAESRCSDKTHKEGENARD